MSGRGHPDPQPMTGRDEHRRAERLDASRLVAVVAAAGGPPIELVRPLTGGALGAFLVRRPDGREAVLTYSPPALAGAAEGTFEAAHALMDLARAHGVPAPHYEDVVPLPDGGVAVLQRRQLGVPVGDVSGALVDHAVELAELRRGLLRGTSNAQQPCPLYLTSSGPGYCHHDPLRHHSTQTRDLLVRIEAVGTAHGDQLHGADLVHLDYTLGNVLVDRHDPDRITGIVDWDGARAGDLTLDLVVLRFDLSWRAPAIGERLERDLLDATDPTVFLQAWAHVGLRMVDWTIRHQPEPAIVDHWTALASRYV